MARQRSIIKLGGTIGGITFYKSKDGYLAREKGGVSADRIRNDPAFQRTRENGAEFGRAGKAGKVLRNSIRHLLQNINDSKMVSRLTKEMVKVVQMDTTNPRGLRNVIDGEAELLIGFDFNANGKLGNTIYAPWENTLDRATGEAGISFQPFVPTQMITAPGGTTHFKLTAAAMEIDFENETYVAPSGESDVIAWDNHLTAALDIPLQLTEDSTHPLFLALGVEFYQQVNGVNYPLKNGTYNALKLIDVIG
ncbi:hypothetical protein [Chryseobacterium sp. FH1]|uniref:hypothetical protein n=1 Tax=Chryseobacterium sp. FH1 TaxID=1233951 RepID=UPI0004E426EF|nr:hypothetical protein [Chryseobacterium sp. FH1]KFC19336.1 hypothetical protein IO90_08485 [Chryseobacterium sp. FH1]